MGHRREILYVLLVAAWTVVVIPGLAARYSFGWDSSQFDRAIFNFNIALHQPQPPGYPFWVLASRGLTAVVGNPNRAQIFLALLFTLGGLWFFLGLARDLLGNRAAISATALLAFSPLTCLEASSSQVYSVDLFLSAFAATVAAKLWSGNLTTRSMLGFAVVGLAAGFRPSGAVLMLPLMCVALLRCSRNNPWRAAAAMAAWCACWLAWWTPTALATGGFRALAALDHAQMASSFATTSVFYGAPAPRHLKMFVEVCLYFAISAGGFLVPLAACLRFRGPCTVETENRACRSFASPAFFGLWMAPNLALVFLFHCGQPGYILLSVPPLALLLAWAAQGALNRMRWTVAGVSAALVVSYFPYELFMSPSRSILPFLMLRATPHISGLIETSQRDIRRLIDAIPGRPNEKALFCLRSGFEAPNIRTVTYDFADVLWAGVSPSGLRIIAPRDKTLDQLPPGIRWAGLVCDGAGPTAVVREKLPQLHRLSGNAMYSFWTGPASSAQLQAIVTAGGL